MKKIIFIVLSILLLISCSENKGTDVSKSESINDIKVEKLFVVDGITVYRFYDGRRVVYFTNKNGKVEAFSKKHNPATKTTKTIVTEALCNE